MVLYNWFYHLIPTNARKYVTEEKRIIHRDSCGRSPRMIQNGSCRLQTRYDGVGFFQNLFDLVLDIRIVSDEILDLFQVGSLRMSRCLYPCSSIGMSGIMSAWTGRHAFLARAGILLALRALNFTHRGIRESAKIRIFHHWGEEPAVITGNHPACNGADNDTI